jgi:hypothetical protein
MGKKRKKPQKQKVEDFPPLTPPSGSPRSPTKNQLFAMITELKGNHEVKITKFEGNIEELKGNHEANITKLKGNIEELKASQEQLKVLGRHWSRNDLILCAAEILKWSVNLRGADGSDGRQFFRNDLFGPVVVGSKVMGLSLREYQELSHRCIILRNSTAHFATIEALEVAVAHSAHAIKIFPDFWTELPDQCGVIERYQNFKKAFPYNFI